MAQTERSRNVNAKEAVECIRGPMTNGELMEKFKISPKGFADLLKQLFEHKLITAEDLSRRGIKFKLVRKELAEEKVGQPVMVPVNHPEDFLDTVELTELLSLKPPAQVEQAHTKSLNQNSTDLPNNANNADIDGTSEKKSKFSLTGFFKKMV
mgnify:CR=1 FL=1